MKINLFYKIKLCLNSYSKRELALFTLDPQRKQHISHITPLKQATPSTMTLKQDTACT